MRNKPHRILLAMTSLWSLSAQSLPGIPTPSFAALDSAGSIYVAGNTTAPLSTTPGVFQPTTAGSGASHGFLAKLNAAGNQLQWVTFLTAGTADSVSALAVTADGQIYVAGSTNAPLKGVATTTPANHLYLEKVSTDGKTLLAATVFGGTGQDTITKLVQDSSGNLYVAGTTSSTDFPTTPGAWQRTLGSAKAADANPCTGPTDQFAAKFDGDLKSLLFSTFIGTPAAEESTDLAIGPDGSMYLAGARTPNRNSPCGAGLLTRLNPQGSAAIYSVVLAGTSAPPIYAVAVDSTGTAYIASDNRLFGLASPEASLSRIDPQGNVAAHASLLGHVTALSTSAGTLGVLGSTLVHAMTPIQGGAPACVPTLDSDRTFSSYFARLDTATLSPTYLGYLTTTSAWLASADRLVAMNPYATTTPFAILPAGPPAPGTVTCMANAADFQTVAVAPGEIVTLFGAQIGPAAPLAGQPGTDGKIPTSLGGIRILANDLPAPLLYAAPGQINAVMPFGIAEDNGPAKQRGMVHIELYRDQSLLYQFDKLLVAQHPGAFALPAMAPVLGTPIPQLAALNQDGTVNSFLNPATSGSIVTIFVTGLGVMTPPLPDGAIAITAANVPVQPVPVAVNLAPAEVLYMGNAPTLVQGVVQINLRLPTGLAAGPAYIGIGLPHFPPTQQVTGGTVAVR